MRHRHRHHVVAVVALAWLSALRASAQTSDLNSEAERYATSLYDRFRMAEMRPLPVVEMLYEAVRIWPEGSTRLSQLMVETVEVEEEDHDSHGHGDHGGHEEGHDDHDDHDEKDHSDHEHDHAAETAAGAAATEDSHDGHDHDHENHDHAKRQVTEMDQLCVAPDEVLQMFNISEDADSLTVAQLQELSPALMWMSTSEECVNIQTAAAPQQEQRQETPEGDDRLEVGFVWLYTMVSTLVVSLLSLGGLFVMPLVRRSKTAEFITLNGLMALAVGALIGDATLHLLPEVYTGAQELAEAGHDHSDHADEAGGGSHEGHNHGSTVGYGLLVILGAYMFFLLEDIPALLPASVTHKLFSLIGAPNNQTDSHQSLETSEMERENTARTMQLAIMVLISDSIHNIMDGLAIGTAFGVSWQLGVSTSIAVALHELPHEFADFAVLLKAGIRPLRAALFNFISGLSAMLGGAIAVASGTVSRSFTIGTLAFVAGNFLYLSLNGILVHLQNSAYLSEEEEANLRMAHDWSEEGSHGDEEKETDPYGTLSGTTPSSRALYQAEGVVAVDGVPARAMKKKQRVPLYLSKFVRLAIVHTGVIVGVLLMVLIALFAEDIDL